MSLLVIYPFESHKVILLLLALTPPNICSLLAHPHLHHLLPTFSTANLSNLNESWSHPDNFYSSSLNSFQFVEALLVKFCARLDMMILGVNASELYRVNLLPPWAAVQCFHICSSKPYCHFSANTLLYKLTCNVLSRVSQLIPGLLLLSEWHEFQIVFISCFFH